MHASETTGLATTGACLSLSHTYTHTTPPPPRSHISQLSLQGEAASEAPSREEVEIRKMDRLLALSDAKITIVTPVPGQEKSKRKEAVASEEGADAAAADGAAAAAAGGALEGAHPPLAPRRGPERRSAAPEGAMSLDLRYYLPCFGVFFADVCRLSNRHGRGY